MPNTFHDIIQTKQYIQIIHNCLPQEEKNVEDKTKTLNDKIEEIGINMNVINNLKNDLIEKLEEQKIELKSSLISQITSDELLERIRIIDFGTKGKVKSQFIKRQEELALEKKTKDMIEEAIKMLNQ